ncbi:ribbon-helix-helix domain-containing protein [Rhizobiales bacterium]|uniref:ribbon-helix-helix domain-containing protein n=1 Tax=Hongsoonwoonella zoysiae TaxID=2821844 RepID=UPI0015602050|nr:ribbon-helix-helix domain-containing protein [Hongsoonwoonella zoysiae]NRG17862.1 ribbon-helix-helix domain-containing protein [Hongsoonwoonella zoysiae]
MSLKKRSLTLHGHRTSLALEPEFWAALEEIALSREMSLAGFIAAVDDARDPESALSSAVRVKVLDHYRNAARAGASREA